MADADDSRHNRPFKPWSDPTSDPIGDVQRMVENYGKPGPSPFGTQMAEGAPDRPAPDVMAMADAGPTEPTRLAHEAIATEPFEFITREGEELGLEEAVFQALGAASMCWSEPPHGIFESDRAKAIGDRLVQFISEKMGGL